MIEQNVVVENEGEEDIQVENENYTSVNYYGTEVYFLDYNEEKDKGKEILQSYYNKLKNGRNPLLILINIPEEEFSMDYETNSTIVNIESNTISNGTGKINLVGNVIYYDNSVVQDDAYYKKLDRVFLEIDVNNNLVDDFDTNFTTNGYIILDYEDNASKLYVDAKFNDIYQILDDAGLIIS